MNYLSEFACRQDKWVENERLHNGEMFAYVQLFQNLKDRKDLPTSRGKFGRTKI